MGSERLPPTRDNGQSVHDKSQPRLFQCGRRHVWLSQQPRQYAGTCNRKGVCELHCTAANGAACVMAQRHAIYPAPMPPAH